jgi:Mg2+/Co2+ transporter CorB
MPTNVAIATAAIIFVFIVFAGVLAWSDYYSTSDRKPTKEH